MRPRDTYSTRSPRPVLLRSASWWTAKSHTNATLAVPGWIYQMHAGTPCDGQPLGSPVVCNPDPTGASLWSVASYPGGESVGRALPSARPSSFIRQNIVKVSYKTTRPPDAVFCSSGHGTGDYIATEPSLPGGRCFHSVRSGVRGQALQSDRKWVKIPGRRRLLTWGYQAIG